MRIALINILTMILSAALTAHGQEDSNIKMSDAPETLSVVLEFKDINVFEYDIDLVFMAEDSSEVWFQRISPELTDQELFTVKCDDGFPVYEVNEAATGKKYTITYVERTVEGEFSGMEEQVREIIVIEKAAQEREFK
jgi:hypothetical protein